MKLIMFIDFIIQQCRSFFLTGKLRIFVNSSFQYHLTTSLCLLGALTAEAPLTYDDYEMDGECYIFTNKAKGGIM